MSLPDVVQLLVAAGHDIQATRYAQLASGSIIIFDHLITLDSEVNLIWKSSWSIGKGLFIVNRYYGLVSVIVNNYGLFSPLLTNACPLVVSLRFFQWQGWTGLIACVITQLILQMRIYALYSLNKKVLALMAVCFLTSTAASAAIMGTVVSNISALALQPLPGMLFCVPAGVSKHFFAFWIPMLFFESLLCGLALFKGFQTFNSSSSAFRSGRHLVDILVRDSVLYFLIMFATYLTNLLVWIIARQTLLEIPIGFSVALSCVLGNRIILNVREVNKELVDARPLSQKVGDYGGGTGTSRIIIPGEGTLTEFEMLQLRSLRAEA